MGAQWKQAGRVANANKRGQIVGKLVKEITVAAKVGDPNPDNNARLRAAIEAARKQSVTRDTIDRALKKAAGVGADAVNYELVTYEGFAPYKIPVIVECLTDNKNRTAADIRVLFRKGQLGSIGSVTWMFDRMGVVEAHHSDRSLDLEGVAIEAGAQNVEPLDGEIPDGHIGGRFVCDTTDLDAVSKFLSQNGWTVTLSEMNWLAKNTSEVADPEQKKEVTDFLTALDDHDDVHRVYAAVK